MNCIVTAGPTYEKMDDVRRLTNFSTGQLGTELANFLTAHGHHVTLLIGEQATFCGERKAQRVESFSTTRDLHERLVALSQEPIKAVFHAAAVSDFTFGKIWSRSKSGALTEIRSGKISTRDGDLLAELTPTPKLIAGLRGLFPGALLIGWKYEVDGKRADALQSAEKQIRDCHTNACVANGPAYGDGFGLVQNREHMHLDGKPALYEALARFIK